MTINPFASAKSESDTILPSTFGKEKSVATSPIWYPTPGTEYLSMIRNKKLRFKKMIFICFLNFSNLRAIYYQTNSDSLFGALRPPRSKPFEMLSKVMKKLSWIIF